MIKKQKSFVEQHPGILYLVPTPIGNLEDITFRSIRILKEVDLIAAEDTRQTKKLLNHFEIGTSLVSYHEHNKGKSGEQLITQMIQGKQIALVSDAGMPSISDPGYEIVTMAIQEGIAVIPLPGANAALPALVASGLPTDHFYFFGFLNRQKRDKKKQLEELKYVKDTIIFYESPHRLKETLSLMLEILGERNITLCRELTKKFEEFLRGTLSDAIEWANQEEIRGEFCLVLSGTTEEEAETMEWWNELTIKEHIEHYISVKGMKPNDAIKNVAKERNMQKREVYHIYHID